MNLFRAYWKTIPLSLKALSVYSLASLLLYTLLPFNLNLLFSAVLARLILFLFPAFFNALPKNGDFLKENKNLFLHFFGFAMLGFFYSETAVLNTVFFPKLDSLFIQLDQSIFGFQPSIEFSKVFNSLFFMELMCFSYISYYFIFLGTLLILKKHARASVDKAAFIILFSFLLYYIFFIFVPVAGPQFAFSGKDSYLASGGIFRSLLTIIHQIGEGPTAAFPSSHVGIAVLCLMLIFPHSKTWFYALIPLILMLCISTVYIKAHYFVDVIGGLLSAPILFVIGQKIWTIIYQEK